MSLNGDVIQNERIDGNRYILNISPINNEFVASVYEFHNQITLYYLINSETGLLTELENAIWDDERNILPLEPFGWLVYIDKYFGYKDPNISTVNYVKDNIDGFNRLGIITSTQTIGSKLLINDGFRFTELCIETGSINALYQWNTEFHEVNICSSVIRLSENIIAYTTKNNDSVLIIQFK